MMTCSPFHCNILKLSMHIRSSVKYLKPLSATFGKFISHSDAASCRILDSMLIR